MLRFAWRRDDFFEVRGQVIRMLAAGPASSLGIAPLGNTGGARVGITSPMPIPEDLQELLRDVAR
jgi:hypothetical protein